MGTSNKLDKTRKQKAIKSAATATIISTTSDTSITSTKSEEIKIVKEGVKIRAQKKETADEIKIVLSFD